MSFLNLTTFVPANGSSQPWHSRAFFGTRGYLLGYAVPVANQRKQKTDKGLEIPVPTKGEFDAAMRKVAPPVGRKRPDEKDRPQKQSE